MKPSITATLVPLSSLSALLQFSGCEKESVGPHRGTLFERSVLHVDDYFDVVPADSVHDSFMSSVLANCRQYTDSIYVYNVYKSGPGGQPRELLYMYEESSLAELLVDWMFEDWYAFPGTVPRE